MGRDAKRQRAHNGVLPMSRVFGWLAFALVLMLGPVSAQVVNPPYTPVSLGS